MVKIKEKFLQMRLGLPLVVSLMFFASMPLVAQELLPFWIPAVPRTDSPLFFPFEREPRFFNYKATDICYADFESGYVVVVRKINNLLTYQPYIIPIRNYIDYLEWKEFRLSGVSRKEGKLTREGSKGLKWEIPIRFPKVIQSFIGEGGTGLQVTGASKITFSGTSTWTESEEGEMDYPGQSKFPSLNMEQESRFRITGTIGSKISVTVDQDSKRNTELQNTVNIKYTGEEDDIIQNLEAGNTTIGLPNTRFVGYSEHVQGLFGIKGQFQLGNWEITAIASQEKGTSEKVTINAGASQSTFTIADYEYIKRKYFFIDDRFMPTNFTGEDSLISFDVYVDDRDNTNDNILGAHPGWAVLDPFYPDTTDEQDSHYGNFHKLDVTDYYIDARTGQLTLAYPVDESHALAVSYVVKTGTDIDTVGGTLPDGRLLLKLVKMPDRNPSMHCWRYEMRNIYSLHATNIDPDGLEINIYRGSITDSVDALGATKYIEIFGLDQQNEDMAPIPDGKVDRVYINYSDGELIFPALHPFAPEDIDTILVPSLALLPDTAQVPEIYNSNSETEIRQNSKFVIWVKTSARTDVYNLGRFNIIEGSEDIRLNGTKLVRGVDYTIDYFSGQVTFLNPEATNPNAQVTINFEYEPFFQPEAKNLLGTRVVYRFGDDDENWVGSTVLYKSEVSAEDRPRVGREPSKTLLTDVDISYQKKLPFLTSLVNAIPFVSTDAESKFEFSAEAAECFSNPNSKKKAYLDDFESAKDVVSLDIRRTTWTLASAPLGKGQDERGRLWWYNPYDRVPVKEIWPEKEVTAEESKVPVLVLNFADTAGIGTGSWAGIMRALPSGYYDQRETKYLEVWVKGNKGVLHIDLGVMQEDVNGDGILNTEDADSNGVLYASEDVGLDGLADEDEPGYNPSSNPDPNGDNWRYDSPYDYSHINGTEGNRNDPDGGRNPDTEDINHDGFLERFNNYFEFDIDLSSSHFEVPGTRSTESGDYWRLYRIPIQDSLFTFVEDGKVWHRKEIGNPDWQYIKFARLWVDGVEDSSIISIASIELVGNKWQTESDYLDVSVKNTHENADYIPPPGVQGERDPRTGLREAEQSLVLYYNDLPPGSTATAVKQLLQAEDYTYYQRLHMFVYWNGEGGIAPILFLRMGADENNFYEFGVTLSPLWNENNFIDVDFAKLTAFKNEAYLSLDSGATVVDTTKQFGNKYFRVKGQPSLTNIRRYTLGVKNPDELYPISGEIWVDELTLRDVRKEPGGAQRAEVRLNLADIGNVASSVERKDSEFHSLREKKGTGTTTTSTGVSGQLYLDKFAPRKLGMSLPVSVSYNKNWSTPRLVPGSDIILPDSLRTKQQTISRSYGVTTSLGFNVDSQNWLIQGFVNRIRNSFSYRNQRSTGPTTPLSLSENTSFQNTYDASPKSMHFIKPLEFLAKLLKKKPATEDTIADTIQTEEPETPGLPKGDQIPGSSTTKGIWNTKLYYLPKTIKFDTQITGSHSRTIDQYKNDRTTINKTLNHTFTLGYQLLDPLTTNLNLNIKRDIRFPSSIYIRKDKIQIGAPLSRSLTTQTSFSPKPIFILTHNYNFSTNYSENTDPQRNQGYFGSVSLSRTVRGNWTVDLKKIPGIKKKGSQGEGPLLRMLQESVGRIGPVKLSGSHEENVTKPALLGRPLIFFQLGWTTTPGVGSTKPTGSSYTTVRDQKTTTDNISANTRVKLFWSFNLDNIGASWRRTKTRSSTSTEDQTLVLPDARMTWSGLSKIDFIKKYAKSTTFSSSYKRTLSKGFQNDLLSHKTETNDFAPLISVSIAWKNNVQTKFDHTRKYSRDENTGAASPIFRTTSEKSYSFNASYSFSAPQGIKLPLIKTIRFENTLTTSLTFTLTRTTSKNGSLLGGKARIDNDIKEWNLTPKLTYRFSRNLDGALEGKFTNRKNMLIKSTQKTREISIWVELKF